mgnify:CR=1 FL=1
MAQARPAARTPPMVKGLPLLGNTLRALEDVCGLLVEAYHAYGPVFRLSRLGREATVLAGLEANAFFLEHEQELFYGRDVYRYLASEGGTPHNFIALDGPEHRHLRRELRLGFSRQLIAHAVPGLVEQVQATARGWEAGQSFDALETMANLVMEQAGSALLGHSLDPTDYGPLNAFCKTFVGVGVDIQPPIMLRRPAYRRGRRRFFQLREEIFAAPEARGPAEGRPLNQIDVARRATYHDGRPLSERDAKACTYFSYVMNGVYTNRSCANLLYSLLKDPALMGRVLAEVDAVCDAGPVTITALQRMPVLRAAIRETLRRYPIPAGLPRHVKADFEFGGYTIRKGEKVYIAASVTHFLPELFPDPLTFDADRFLPPRDEHRRPRALLPFGAGAHACLGSSLATLFTQTTMVGLLRAASFQLEPRDYVVRRVADPMPGPSGMGVRAHRRQPPPPAAERARALDDEEAALFAGADLDRAQQDALVARSERRVYGPGELIIRQGDEADAFYMLAHGQLEVVLEEPGQAPRPIDRLGDGAFFGELGLLQGVRRTATVRVGPAGPAEVLVMGRESFLEVVAEFDLVEAEIAALVRRRGAQLALARALPALGREQIAALSPAIAARAYGPGEPIIRQGDPAREFFIVARGEVEVLSGERLIDRLATGDYFGEIGLLHGRPRTATVRAGPGGAEALALGPEALRAIVAGSAATESAIAALVARRLTNLAGAGPSPAPAAAGAEGDSAARTEIGYDPFLWSVQDDPYPFYRRLREEAPVHHLAERDLWVVTRWADCMAVLEAPRQWSSARGNFINDLPQRAGLTMATTDPPRHSELRGLVEAAFTPERIAALEPVVRATAQHLVGGLRGAGGCEFVGQFAAPLTASLMGQLFGVPREDLGRLGAWLAAAVHTRESDPGGAPPPEFGLIFGYIAEMVRARRAEPGADLTSALTLIERDGGRLSDEEIVITVGTMVAAAIQSTNMQLGNVVVALARHPEQRAAVRAHPALIPAMLEEAVRWDTALQGLLRTASEDGELGGVRIPAGASLFVSFGAANRDPAQFADPERFDIARPIERHLGYGWGPHQCIGRPLARLAMRVAFEELLPALGDYELVPGEAQRTRNPNLRGFQRLPIRY